MITEEYVSFETAKLLKEKGFDYYPDGSYWLIDANNVMYWVSEIGAYDYVDVPTESFQRPKNGYRLVTQAMAMKWLREVHHLFIGVEPRLSFTDYYWITANVYRVRKKNSLYHAEPVDDYSCVACCDGHSFEDACESALKYCLENLI